ncbi:zinc metalloprotease [Oxalobacteraceae bacterium A2-2]
MKAKPALPRRTCGTSEAHARLCEQYPEFRVARGKIHAETAVMIRRGLTARAKDAGPLTIPVVVHVVYRDQGENISDAQVRSQIDALNRDFNAENKDKANTPKVWAGLVANVGLRFALADQDPKGKASSGIVRVATSREEFSTNDDVKYSKRGGSDAWPTAKYLNIWVCTLGGGLLGYAQFPGGPAATDGVVILNTAFGTKGTAAAPFNLGRTTVHEVGHWLNLNHIWGDTSDCSGTDHVEDTPNAQLPNYNKPSFPHVSCSNGPNGDMFMNYMDYVDDDTMVMFTPGQKERMLATLKGPRKNIK